jgi:DNA-binding XRE family transcriptional regulator
MRTTYGLQSDWGHTKYIAAVSWRANGSYMQASALIFSQKEMHLMKVDLGRCLLEARLLESGMAKEELARILRYNPARLTDYMENKRIMPLKTAISIAGTIGCRVRDLYELIPVETAE